MTLRSESFPHPAVRALFVVLTAGVVIAGTTHNSTAAGVLAEQAPVSAPQNGTRSALQLAYELEQPANMGSGLSVPGDVNIVGEGGFDARDEAPAVPAEEGHRGVVVGAPVGDAEPSDSIEVEREQEIEARRGRPMGIDGPSDGQLDLETPSVRQMELETPSARQRGIER